MKKTPFHHRSSSTFTASGRSAVKLALTVILALVLWGPPAGSAGDRSGRATAARPNIVMVWIDTLRADHLEAYGYRRNTAPHLDRLARDSIVFRNHYASNSVTITSFMSIITSLYPASHGVFHVAKDRLSNRVKTLAEILKLHGYATTWLGPDGCPHLDPAIGYGRGFDTVGIFDDDLARGRQTLFEALEKNRDQPFFINFHSYKVHDPYFPAPEYRKMWVQEERPEAIETTAQLDRATYEKIARDTRRRDRETVRVLGKKLSRKLMADGMLELPYSADRLEALHRYLEDRDQLYKLEELRCEAYIDGVDYHDGKLMAHFSSLYDAEISEFDTEVIGPMVSKLKSMGLYEDAIIIVCADHGEEFGEHGYMGHGQTLYDEVIYVPWIMKIPSRPGKRQISVLTTTVDIAPTLLDVLGISPPHHAQGKSLLPSIRSPEARAPHDFVFGQLASGDLIVRSLEWKLVLKANDDLELYDLRRDRQEARNLVADRPDVVARLKKELFAWKSSLPNYRVASDFRPNIDEAARERIKKTGYW